MLILLGTLLTACSTGVPRSVMSAPYKAGSQNWTNEGRLAICDTAGPVSRSVTRCF